jgi:hypothetical protein
MLCCIFREKNIPNIITYIYFFFTYKTSSSLFHDLIINKHFEKLMSLLLFE